jgi:hypothetical protein
MLRAVCSALLTLLTALLTLLTALLTLLMYTAALRPRIKEYTLLYLLLYLLYLLLYLPYLCIPQLSVHASKNIHCFTYCFTYFTYCFTYLTYVYRSSPSTHQRISSGWTSPPLHHWYFTSHTISLSLSRTLARSVSLQGLVSAVAYFSSVGNSNSPAQVHHPEIKLSHRSIYICMNICMYMYVCICMYTYTHTHTHTHLCVYVYM